MKKLALTTLLLLSSFCYGAVSLEQQIGQMIIIGFDGNKSTSTGFKKILEQSKKGEISGVILFSKNIDSKDELIKMNKKLITSSKPRPFISIDNEGGFVQRYIFVKQKSAKEVSELEYNEAKKEYSNMAELLEELNINLNFGPCVDLAINPNSIIVKKERSYGDNPTVVTKYAKIFIEEHNNRKIGTSIKHFPGHGSVTEDTHLGFVDATKTYKQSELQPYKNLKNYNHLNMVMISHIYNSNFDKNYPASLSKNTVKNILMDNIGYNGIIISDDFDMGAIRKNYSLRDIVVHSINSGINILLFSNNLNNKDSDLPIKIQKIVKEELKKGNIKIEDIENSYRKIIAFKNNLNSDN